MLRKTIILLAASVAMGMAQMSIEALAAPLKSGSASGTPSSGVSSTGKTSISGPSAAVRGPSTTGTISGPRTMSSAGVSGGTWNGGNWRHRHHRFHNRFVFVAPYAYAAYDSCYDVRRVWTRWGWRWHRVYVCDYPYDDY